MKGSRIFSSSLKWFKFDGKWINPQINSIKNHTEKPLTIVVCAKQYGYSMREDRGFGDIASGAKISQIIKNKYPKAHIGLIAEHSIDMKSTNNNDLEKIKSIINIENIDSHLIGKDINLSTQEKEKIAGLLTDASFIYHAPVDIINPITENIEKLRDKIYYTSEYDRITSTSSDKLNINIEMAGFRNDLLLIDDESPEDTFEYPDLTQLITGAEHLYFSYGASKSQSLSLINLIANIDEKAEPLLILSDEHSLIDKYIESDTNNIDLYKVSIKNGEKVYTALHKCSNPKCRINIFTPTVLSNSDLKKIQALSKINITSGDISTSEIISLNKIPFIVSSKRELMTYFYLKILEFENEHPNEKKFSALVDLLYQSYPNMNDPKLSFLLTDEWHKFELSFTTWLKQKNRLNQVLEELLKNK